MPDRIKEFSDLQKLVSKFGNALGHPVRVAVLQLLLKQTHCYHGDMAKVLPIVNSTLSQHLKVLKESGLIKGETSPPKIKYCIDRDNWNLAKGLMIGFFE